MDSLKIVAVASSEETRKALYNQLQALDFVEFDGVYIELSDAVRKAQEQRPDVIIIELTGRQEDGGLFIQAIGMNPEYPCVIFALHREMDLEVFKGAIKHGAKQFIQYPEDQQALDASLKQHMAFLQRVSNNQSMQTDEKPTREIGKIITLYASKGGSGSSTVAYNLAHEIQVLKRDDVILIDLDQFYCNSKLFRMEPEYSLGDLAQNKAKELDDGIFKKIVVHHPETGMAMIAGCKDVLDENEMIQPELIESVLDYASRKYRYVIVDLPSHVLDPYHQYMVERSDLLLLVSTLDIPSLSRTRQYMDLAQKYLDMNKLKLVLNRCTLKSAFSYSNQDLEEQFHHAPFARLANDWDLNVEANSKGAFLSQINPKAELARNLRELAQLITGKDSPVSVTAANGNGKGNLIGKLFGASNKKNHQQRKGETLNVASET
jgi:pilus assembly protein CpaE